MSKPQHNMNDDYDFSLTSLFPSTTPPPEDDFIQYGPLTLSLPSTEGKANNSSSQPTFQPRHRSCQTNQSWHYQSRREITYEHHQWD